jgi:hypothetical protein
MRIITSTGGIQTSYLREFKRGDVGISVPDDGYMYVMAQHEILLFGTTRHGDSNQRDPRPAVVNKDWGLETLAKANGDYVPVPDEWQRFFLEFWNGMTGFRLPMGQWIGQHTEKNNPGLIFDDYTPGSLLSLYAGMIRDAKSHTDSASPETGARDVVTGRNLSNPKPWAWLCRPCTGALLRVLEVSGTKLKIEAMDLWKSPPNPYNLPPYLYYYGTQVDINGRVTRYPDAKNAFAVWGWEPIGTAMPLVSPGGYFWIRKNATVTLTPGQLWKPYYP